MIKLSAHQFMSQKMQFFSSSKQGANQILTFICLSEPFTALQTVLFLTTEMQIFYFVLMKGIEVKGLSLYTLPNPFESDSG